MWEAEIDLRAGDRINAEKNAAIAESKPGVFNTYPKLRLAQLLRERGELERSAALLDEVEAISRERIRNGHEGWYFPWNLAFIHSLRGEREEALSRFEEAVEAGRRRFEWDEQEIAFGLIANEPRFQAALQQQRITRKEMKKRAKRELKHRW
jgi:tetratricopeptide (TPR) repeat protein